MRPNDEENIEIAGRAAAQAGLAFAGEPDARAILDAGRDVDRKRALAGDAALAAAIGAQGSEITWPRPWQVGQVRSTVKKPWHAPTAPCAAAGGAGLGMRAGLGARALAGLARRAVGTRICAVLPAKASVRLISML